MALVMTPIYTQTVGSGGASQIVFNNIPQFYTDLRLVMSVRTTSAGSGTVGGLQFGTSGTIDTATNYSRTFVQGYGSGAFSGRNSSQASISLDQFNGGGSTASTFGNAELTIPNYTQANFKSVVGDLIAENNSSTDNNVAGIAGLWRNTNAITMIQVFAFSANFVQHSTFSLYGIIRQGA
jgi:hypothetical protein